MHTCSICLSQLVREYSGSGRVCCIPCGHVFHYRCLSDWLETPLESVKSCPQCRRIILERDVLMLYFNHEGTGNDESDGIFEFWKYQENELTNNIKETEEQVQISLADSAQSCMDFSKQIEGTFELLTSPCGNEKLRKMICSRMQQMNQGVDGLSATNELLVTQISDLISHFKKHCTSLENQAKIRNQEIVILQEKIVSLYQKVADFERRDEYHQQKAKKQIEFVNTLRMEVNRLHAEVEDRSWELQERLNRSCEGFFSLKSWSGICALLIILLFSMCVSQFSKGRELEVRLSDCEKSSKRYLRNFSDIFFYETWFPKCIMLIITLMFLCVCLCLSCLRRSGLS